MINAIKKLLKKSIFFKNEPDEILLKYANLIIEKHAIELMTNKDLPSLLGRIEDYQKNIGRLVDETMEYRNYISRLQDSEDNSRKHLENNVIHLKDIIQAKDLIIQKLEGEK